MAMPVMSGAVILGAAAMADPVARPVWIFLFADLLVLTLLGGGIVVALVVNRRVGFIVLGAVLALLGLGGGIIACSQMGGDTRLLGAVLFALFLPAGVLVVLSQVLGWSQHRLAARDRGL